MDSYIFYGLAIVLLILSFVKDKKKTKMALKKAWKAFENILPEFLVVILLVGFLLAILNPKPSPKSLVLNPDGLVLYLQELLDL